MKGIPGKVVLWSNEYRIENKVVTGSKTLTTEVERALKNMKNEKATGTDNVKSNFWNWWMRGIQWIPIIFNNIYDAEDIPKEWLKSKFIALPKKMRNVNYTARKVL